jgi:hypothetical protein
MNVGEVNEDGQALGQRTLTRLSRVCGLAARQRVPLTLEKFEDLAEDEKNKLFANSIQWYVVYPEELKEKGKRAAMKGISHSWRSYKNRLTTCLRKKQNPFEKFKDLKEDWERFIAKCESLEFIANSETVSTCGNSECRMSLTTTLATPDMPETRASWNGRIKDWPSKVSRIHDKFSGQLRPFMCARSKLIEIGEITYYN